MKLFQEYYDYKNGGFCIDGELLTQDGEETHYSEIGSIIKEAQNKIEFAVWEARKKWEAAIEKKAIKIQEERKEKEEEKDEETIQIPKRKGRKVLPESDDEEEMIIIPKKKKAKKSKGKKKLLIVEDEPCEVKMLKEHSIVEAWGIDIVE